MNPTFAMIQWIARDHEEQIRRETNGYHYRAEQARPSQARFLPVRLANALRGVADRLDPEPVCTCS